MYQVIYADPPWRYEFAPEDRIAIEATYRTMSQADLCAMRVPADPKGCALFMWATAPKIAEGLELIESWGFTYKTQAIWDKVDAGLGYWFRGQHELLLVATMGAVVPPAPEQRIRSIIRCRRTTGAGTHSLKPHSIREMVASWYPSARRLEMFARESHSGWDTFGNEVSATLFDQTPRQVDIA